jgi:CheY-like chemotaxis protein/AraC-like DNA-binding protein
MSAAPGGTGPRFGPGAATVDGSDRTYRVLVVDDEPEGLRLMLELMRGFGLDLATALNAEVGLRNARRLLPDLILLDIMLPDGNGLELCRRLKARPETAEIPVIFLTARVDLADKVAGFGAGGLDYVTKPFAAQELLLRVLSHLDLARQRRALAERLACWEPPCDLPPLPPLDLPAQTPPAILRILLRARDRLLADLAAPPSLEDLAAHACTNRTTLTRLFKQYLGMTAFDYLREQRLQQGRRLLASSGLPIADCAERVGYQHTRDFSAAFKQRFGLTPAAYRAAAADHPFAAA